MKKFAPILGIAVLIFGFALTGCKSPAEKACANMAELEGDEVSDEDMEECVKEAEEEAGECEGDGDEYLECIADLESEDGFKDCVKICAGE